MHPLFRKVAGVGLRLLLATSIALLFACNKADRNKPNDEKKRPAPLSSLQLDSSYKSTVLWQQQVGRGLRRYDLGLRVAFFDNRVYAADSFGTVAAFDSVDGELLWQIDLFSGAIKDDSPKFRSFLSGGLSADTSSVFLATLSGEVFALNRVDGSIRWRTQLSSEILSVPYSDGGSVLVQSIDGQLSALKADDGRRIWVYDSSVPRLSLRGTASPIANRGLVFAGFASGKVSALNDRGQVIWEDRISTPDGRSELERIVDVDASPITSGEFVYAASYGGSLKALQRDSGQTIWEYRTRTSREIATGFAQVYVVDDESRILAIDAVNGTPVWSNDSLRHRKLNSPVIFGNYLVVPDQNGYLYVFSQTDGALLTYHNLAPRGKGVRAAPTVGNGTLYALAANGSLVALRIDVES